jgi:hypothetical protein
MVYFEDLEPAQQTALTDMLLYTSWFNDPKFMESTYDANTVQTPDLKRAIAKAKKLLFVQQKNPEKAALCDKLDPQVVLDRIKTIEKSGVLRWSEHITMTAKPKNPPPVVDDSPATVAEVRKPSLSPPPAKRKRVPSPTAGFFKDLGSVLSP